MRLQRDKSYTKNVRQKFPKNGTCKQAFSSQFIIVRINLGDPAADSWVTRKSKRVCLLVLSCKHTRFDLFLTQLSSVGSPSLSSYMIAGPSFSVQNVYDMLAAIGRLVRYNNKSTSSN